MVEFAATLPFLMMVITGTASFSLALYSLQQLSTATGSAVQAVAAATETTDPCVLAQNLIQGNSSANIAPALPGMPAANLSYQMSITDATGTAHQYPSSGWTTGTSTFSCTAAGVTGTSPMALGEPVTLSVKYSYSWVPIVFFKTLAIPLYSTESAMAD